MNHVNVTRNRSRQPLRATPVAAAVAALLCTSEFAFAQQAAETITITGIRRGIESAISVKKNSDSIVEAISAEDIGKLPDSSIAESIARLPGLTAQRVAGRAQNISIRGLSGDFSTALLNGREQVSTSDNRSVEFDQYPSELLSGVTVYKTPDAALMGQGLSGTIDMQTVRPLNFGKRTIAVNARKEKSGVGTEFTGDGTRFNLSYIDQFADRTIGVAFGVAQLKSDVGSVNNETYNTNNKIKWDGTNVWPEWDGSRPGAVVEVNSGFKFFNNSTKQTRTGAMGVIEFKPNKDLSSIVDLYYSKFEKDVVKRGLEIQVEDSWRNDPTNARMPGLINPVITGGKLMSATWTNVNPLSRHIAEPRTDEVQAAGWNTRLKLTPKLTGIADLSYSEAKRKEQTNELEAGIPTPQRVTVANYNQITAFQYDTGDTSLVKLMDPESWGQNGYSKEITTKDKLSAIRLGGQQEMEGFLSRLNFGVNLSDRKKDKTANEWKLLLKGNANSSGLANLPAGATSVAVGGTNFKSVSFDPASIYPSAYDLLPNVNADILQKGWKVQEKVATAYVKGDVDTDLFGVPVRGNIGVQLANTDQSSSAPQVDERNQGVFTTFTDGKKYNDILPSLNLSFDLGNTGVVRVAAARQMARARMDQMYAGRRYSIDSTSSTWTGSGGNPKLDPFRANAFDVSYEKYFGTKAYVAAAAFYKSLSSYVFDYTDTAYNFSGVVAAPGQTVPPTVIGRFSQPRNGKGGKISGVELTASLPLNMATAMLDGFGVEVSFASTTSAIKPFGDADSRSLPGLSRKVSKVTAYYEKFGFGARIAQRSRSDFLGEIQGFGAGRSYQYIKGESITDLQLSYEFQTGMAKGLSFLLQVNNLGDAKYQEYKDTPSNITNTVKYGKTYLFGANYKF